MNFISRSILMKLLVVCGAGTVLFLLSILISLWLTPDFTTRVILITIAAGIAFLALVITVNQAILSPIKNLVSDLDQLAKCNFASPIRITSSDEIGEISRSAEKVRTQIGSILMEVNQSATEISTTLHKLTDSANQAAYRSSAQSDEAVAMSSLVESMTSNIDSVAAQASQVQEIAVQADNLSGSGSAIIHRTVSEMERIASSVNASSQAVQSLELQSDKIGEIVKVIKEIADQTNLLALNAAIEAARAGEQGRGFAVVADEVRKLAERTSASTAEIGKVIQDIQTQTSGAVSSMNTGVAQVKEGASLAREAGISINDIKSSAQLVVQSVNNISATLRQQSSSNSSNASKVEKIAQLAQENSASINDIASQFNHLASKANNLQAAVAVFRT